MKLKSLTKELAALKMMYEDALLKKAPAEEVKKILQKIEEVNRQITVMSGEPLQ